MVAGPLSCQSAASWKQKNIYKKSKILANLDSVAASAEFSSVVVGARARPVARAAGPLVGPTHRSLAKAWRC